MKAHEVRALAGAVLRGEAQAPRGPPDRIALASELPRGVEQLRCLSEASPEPAIRGLTALWLSLEPDEFTQEDFGTPQLGAGCLEAAELLGAELPPRRVPARLSGYGERPADFGRYRRLVARPRVFVPVVNQVPARVFHTVCPEAPPREDEPTRATALLVRRFLGIETPRWGLEHQADGRSKMAGLFVRALFERWPEAQEAFGVSSFDAPLELGITGELDEQGLAVDVRELEYKVRSFFTRCPEGRLLVPASQWKQARAYFDRLRASQEQEKSRYRPRIRGGEIQPFRGVLDLLVRLGVSPPGCPETELFDKLRRASRNVPCWNMAVRDVEQTIALTLVRTGAPASDANGLRGFDEEQLLDEVYERWLSGPARSAYIEGGPGSGKSIVLRRLNAWLLEQEKLLGPAFRVEARRLSRARLSLAEALHMSLGAWLSESECQQLERLALSPALAGNVWLLLDGLDEVSKDERRRLREFVARWPGPSILGSRPLPNEISGAPHVRVQSLDEYQQSKLFEVEGKLGHLEALTGSQATISGDRRKEMVADLCSTPLGISLLALLPEEGLGERLDVPTVLKRCIAILLERAEEAGRIQKPTRMKFLKGGLGVLGAAAWSMLRRKDGTLTLEDLQAMDGPGELQESVFEALDGSDFVQRTGPDLYEFSHKSFAEFCAAYHLIRRPEAEEELLALVGEPGTEAVSFHFGALLEERARLTGFIQRLASNPRAPMSSLALATRLLVVNGPERVEVQAALEVLVQRLRLVTHFRAPGRYRFVLPAGLDEDGELWLALSRWGSALRPHSEALIDACPPAVRRFLEGQVAPLRYVYEEFALRQSDEHAAAEIAEELATRLGLEPPLPVLMRFAVAESLLLARPDGPWIQELEALFEVPEDEARANVAYKAASIWARRASTSRQLDSLEALSRGLPAAVAPVLETARREGSVEHKREALLRAALNSLELGATDNEGDWIAKVRFSQRVTGVPSRRWLEQWELLWACGLVGEISGRSTLLEPLYAEFLEDSCGPARWRALVALRRIEDARLDEKRLRAALQDEFRPVRVEAIAQLVNGGYALSANDVRFSLASLDDHERWTAFQALEAGKTEPVELLLPVLRREHPLESESRQVGEWLPEWTPWQQAVRERGERARRELLWALRERVKGGPWPRRLFELMDGPWGDVVEEIFPSHEVEASLFQKMLAAGSPRQRRFAARALPWSHQDLLVRYTGDADPEIAGKAREVVERKQHHAQQQSAAEARRAEERARFEREQRPLLTLPAVAQAGSFEELWKLVATHRIPHSMEAQLAYFAEEEKRRLEFNDEPARPIESSFERDRKPILHRLRQLYRPHHWSMLLAGLEDTDLEPFAIELLREHLAGDDVLSLIPRGGKSLLHAVTILKETSQASRAASLLRDELLSGRLQPERHRHEDWYDQSARLRYLTESFQRDACRQLEELEGLSGLLPLLEPGVPEDWRKVAISYLEGELFAWRRPPRQGHEALAWARREAAEAQDEQIRRLAFRILAFFGTAEDAAQWRATVKRRDLPAPLLAPLVRLIARFGVESDLPVFRSLLSQSEEVAAEAAVALARVGGTGVIEELLQMLEAPPRTLKSNLPWIYSGWHETVAELVIRFGDGPQARRCARALEDNRDVWQVAARYIRLPEHLLFMAQHIGSQDPTADDDDGYDQARKVLDRMIEKVGADQARRVMLEASLWGGYFERGFGEFFRDDELQSHDQEVVLARLREQPDHGPALQILKKLPRGEELIDAVWREQAVTWWRGGRQLRPSSGED